MCTSCERVRERNHFEVDGITYFRPRDHRDRAFGRRIFELRSDEPHEDETECDGECSYLAGLRVAMQWDKSKPIARFTSDGLEVSYFKPVDVSASA